MDASVTEVAPALPEGVTWLIDTDTRSTAPHHLVLAALERSRGEVLWIDARDVASTYTLHALATRPQLVESIHIARAWTAFQHHTLVRQAITRASPRTRLLVLPHVCALYRDDDLDEDVAERLLEASLHLLTALGDALALPVIITAPPTERSRLETVVDHELRCTLTEQGYAFRGEEFRTTVYRGRGWWQTTIPYWVELLGAVSREEEAPWAPAAVHAGLETFA